MSHLLTWTSDWPTREQRQESTISFFGYKILLSTHLPQERSGISSSLLVTGTYWNQFHVPLLLKDSWTATAFYFALNINALRLSARHCIERFQILPCLTQSTLLMSEHLASACYAGPVASVSSTSQTVYLVHFLPILEEAVHTKNDFHVTASIYQRHWGSEVFHSFPESSLWRALFEQGPEAGEKIIKRQRHSHCTWDTWV